MKHLTHLPAAVGDTSNLQSWIQDNIIPLLLLIVVMLFVFVQRGDNAKSMKVVGGVVIALVLAVLGLATSGRADSVGSWLASLVTG